MEKFQIDYFTKDSQIFLTCNKITLPLVSTVRKMRFASYHANLGKH
jgi:hypothetical protein